jgi:transcriptional regulator with XRE-family HTH domain
MNQVVIERRARVAGEIRAELARQGKPVASLAAGTGISPASLSRKLNGRSAFYFEEVAAIAAFLGLPVSELSARFDSAGAA